MGGPVSWAFFLKIAGMAAGYLFALAVGRIGGPDAWGTFALSLMIITIASIVGRAGLDTAALRLIAEYRAKKKPSAALAVFNKALTVVVPAAGLVTIFVFFGANVLAAGLFDRPELATYFRWASLAIVPTCIMTLSTEGLRSVKRVKQYLLLSLVLRHVLALIGFIALGWWLNVDAPMAAVLAYVIAVGITGVLALFLLKNKLKVQTFSSFNSTISYKLLLGISLPLFLASSMQFLKGWVDTLMLGIFMAPADVGVYNIALKLSLLVSVPLMAVNSVAATRFAECHGSKDRQGLEAAVTESTRMVAMFSLPIAAVMLIAPTPLLSLFGADFAGGSLPLRILALAHLVNALSGSVGYLLQMTGGEKAFQNLTLASVVLGVVMNLSLVPPLGLVGAALSTAVMMVVWNVGSILYIRKRYGFSTFYNPFTMGLWRSTDV